MSTPITRIIWNSLPYSLHSRYQRVSLEKCCMLVITVFSQWPGTTDLPEPFLGHLIQGNTNAQQSQSLYFTYTLQPSLQSLSAWGCISGGNGLSQLRQHNLSEMFSVAAFPTTKHVSEGTPCFLTVPILRPFYCNSLFIM